MAKISARGAKEVGRWKKATGATIVLTSDGRILSKWDATAGYSVFGKTKKTGADAVAMVERYATVRGYERSYGR
jgi:dTDP-4-dehydrorhamnose reductase